MFQLFQLGSGLSTEDSYGQMINADACQILDTGNYDHRLSVTLHDDLHWLDAPHTLWNWYNLTVTIHCRINQSINQSIINQSFISYCSQRLD